MKRELMLRVQTCTSCSHRGSTGPQALTRSVLLTVLQLHRHKHAHYVFQVRMAASETHNRTPENTTTNTQQSARISLFHFRVRQRVTTDFLVLVLQRGGSVSVEFIKYKSCTFVLSDETS